jgi:hypothetical protein
MLDITKPIGIAIKSNTKTQTIEVIADINDIFTIVSTNSKLQLMPDYYCF